jgi:PhzF family phenazine biosynthesis protein
MVVLYQVDAFASRPFHGNPAAVCVLEEPADEAWMQAVANEMNLPETAFVVRGEPFALRWFTPTTEVKLCGHATLASAHVLWTEGIVADDAAIRFSTRSGTLAARRADGSIEIDLPAQPLRPAPLDPDDLAAIGVAPLATATGAFELIEVATEAEVATAAPDPGPLRRVNRIFILTAQGDGDVVCRVFAPGIGIDEDPATGSAQCALGPWWAPRLGRTFTTRQLSRRGGTLRVTVADERVLVIGDAVTTLRATLVA